MTELEKIAFDFGGDVQWGTRWPIFLKIVEAAGFKVAFHNTFEGMNINCTEERYVEEEYIFLHDKGLVLYAESCCGGSTYSGINTAKLYFEGTQHSRYNENDKKVPFTGELRNVSYDVRTYFLSQLLKIQDLFHINSVWTLKDPFLWFVNYKDDDEPDYDYKAITRRKIDASLPELRKIIDG